MKFYRVNSRFKGVLAIVTGLLTMSNLFSQAPTVQDCPGAIPVCQPVYSTTTSYTGHGNIYPEIHVGSACPLCMDGEKNDVFYVITVQTSGTLKFSLTPNNANNDYDWALFNMTNKDCSRIYPDALSLQVSCNSYGATGYNGPTGINTPQSNNKNCNGPGTTNGPSWNKDLLVTAGQTYVLNISNWSSSQQSGYTLDFSGSTAVIFDNVPPTIDSIQQEVPCAGTTDLFVRFSENIKCTTAYQHPEKFTLTGGTGGPYTVTGVNSSTCATGADHTTNYTLTVSPKLYGGSYVLNIVGNITDLCDNLALYQGYPFTMTEINSPSAGAGNDTTIANGAFITLHGIASGGASPYTFHWEPASLLTNPDVRTPLTHNIGATTQFSLTVTDSVGCHANDDVLVSVVGGPLGVNATSSPGTICAGASSVLQAFGSGGSGAYTYSWTSNPPGFTSSIPNPTVFPMFTTTYNVAVNDGFSTAYGSTVVNVDPKPVAAAGTSFSIPYGTNAVLSGSAYGSSGPYSYYWTSLPPGYSSAISNPTFTNLQATTIFSLIVTDLSTGCISDPSQVLVTVTGSPLATNPVVDNPVICQGVTTQLHAMAGGGSGNYTYNWTSNPPGFTSSVANPVVSPMESTSYQLILNDGYNQATGSVTVHVNPRPVIHLGPADTILCVYDTILLDAGNPNSNYYWSNGSVARTLLVSSSGIGFEVQSYSVKVINAYGCTDSAKINVTFTIGACMSIHEKANPSSLSIYPNPGHGIFTLKIEPVSGPFRLSVVNLLGMLVSQEEIMAKPGKFIKDLDFSALNPGVYFIRITSHRDDKTLKLVIR
ncbi:MAG: T9SS type A sorting domain-containing protein [Bacteroidetes bacterium]|nr:T9SS type A sorting domain-containing protein [Bacteroidota bacterium]